MALSVASCAEKELATPPQGTDTESTAESVAQQADAVTDSFIRHMHQRAKRVEQLNVALAADDLEAARPPACWPAAHDEVKGIVGAWLPHIEELRNAA